MMKGPGKGKKGEWPQGFGMHGGKGMKGMKGDTKGKGGEKGGMKGQKGFEKGFDKGFSKGKGKGQTEIVVAGCRHETVGAIIRGEYVKFGSNHGRPAYRKLDKPGAQEVQIYFWDHRDGPSMCGWWFGASVGGDMVWSFRPGDAPVPPRSGWKVPFEGQVDPSLEVSVQSPNGQVSSAAPMLPPPQVEVGQDTHITVQGCAHPVVGAIVNGSFIRNGENHGKPVYKKTEQTKDGVDVLIYFWNDVQNPTFCGWWFGPEVGAEQVWAFNSSRLTTAPLSGWKVPYDGPVDPQFHISVDRKASENERRLKAEADAKRHAEVNRALKQIRHAMSKLKHVRVDNLEQLETELREVMAKELDACGPEQAKMKEECEKALEQAKQRVAQLQDAQAKAEPLMKELDSLLEVAEAAIETLQKKVDKGTLEKAEEAIKACSQFVIEGGQVLTVGEGHVEKMQRLQACKKSLKKGHGQKRHQEVLAKMASYDRDKDGLLDEKDLKKYALSEFKFTLPEPAVKKIFKLLVTPGTKGISKDNFQRAKVQIGIVREYQIDLERKKRREEREKELEVMKEKLKGQIEEEVAPPLAKIEESCSKLKEDAEKLKTPTMKSAELITKLDELMSQAAEYREKIAELLKSIKSLKESEKEVIHWLNGQLKPSEQKLKQMDASAAKISQAAKGQRAEADQKQKQELQELQRRALKIIEEYQKAKDILNDGIFGEMSAKDKVVNEKSFIAFFAKCSKECGNGEALEIPDDEDLCRLLRFWDDSGSGQLDEERVCEILRRYMKVTNKTVLTDGVSSSSKSIRKLEVKEVVALLGPPTKDQDIDVTRVKVKCMDDGTEGWVTLSGNQGTHYLEEGGGVFKVVKETLLTADFELDSGAKEKASKVQEDRRLKVGELVEVKSWMKKHEQMGLKRLRCKALSDGAIGWATVVGNAGTVFLEVK